MSGHLEHPGDRLEHLVGEDDPATRPARAGRSPPSPSRARRPARSRGTSRCRSASRPSRGRPRRCRAGVASSQSSPRSTSGERPMSGTANSYQARVRARLRSQQRGARVPCGGSRNVERRRGVGDRVQLGEHLDAACPAGGAGPRATRRTASCRRSCRAARPAGTTPSIRSIRKNGVPSTSPVGSIQRTAGTGTSVRSATIRIASYWSWSA